MKSHFTQRRSERSGRNDSVPFAAVVASLRETLNH
jgi:hypothetical protein